MVLDTVPSYPQARAYVVQFHRDAAAADGLRGRIVHIASGDATAFADGAALLAWLAAHLACPQPAPESDA